MPYIIPKYQVPMAYKVLNIQAFYTIWQHIKFKIKPKGSLYDSKNIYKIPILLVLGKASSFELMF